jgi:anti-sigma regulatory factor (Ser/Thr protein kinase)
VVALTERLAPAAPGAGAGEGIWLPLEDAGSVGTARRAATGIAAGVGLPAESTADLAIVVTELASNLHRHAVEGMLLVRAVRRAGRAGVQIVAVDKGPGLRDLDQSTRDGHSTYGSLGIGLGAVRRRASEFDAYSLVGAGTVMVAAVFPHGRPPPVDIHADVGCVSRPMAGQDVCGDGYAVRAVGDRVELLLCDGLGHGPLAAFAAQAAVAAFHDAPDLGPQAVLEHLHRSLRHTRGAVATVVSLDRAAATARFAGLGNIFGAVVQTSGRQVMAPQPGIVGDGNHRLRAVELPLPGDALVVLHSDGVRDQWNLARYPGLAARDPLVIAATLLRDFGVRRDDAAVLVAKVTP